MTYAGLNKFLSKINEITKIPREELDEFELMTGRLHGNEVFFLIGKSSVGNVLTVYCELFGSCILEDSMVLNVYNRKFCGWEEDLFEQAARCGIEQGVARETLITELSKGIRV